MDCDALTACLLLQHVEGQVVSVDGKFMSDARIKDHQDGTYSLYYVAELMGDYFLAVKIDGDHIHESPFLVYIDHTGALLVIIPCLCRSYSGRSDWKRRTSEHILDLCRPHRLCICDHSHSHSAIIKQCLSNGQ